MTHFYDWAGGRKTAHGLLYAVLVTAMAFPLDASYGAYTAALALGLGLTVGSVAYEDARRPKA